MRFNYKNMKILKSGKKPLSKFKTLINLNLNLDNKFFLYSQMKSKCFSTGAD